MPYSSRSGRLEYARSIGHVPIVENEMVKARLANYRLFTSEAKPEIPSHLLVHADALDKPGDAVRWAMSFDGSAQEVAAREAYPSTRIGYIQVAGVLTHLEEMLSQGQEHLVDPAVIRSVTHGALHSMVLPGSNVCRTDAATVRDSWREEVFEIFRDYTVEHMSLLDIYMLLVEHSDHRAQQDGVVLARCSASDSCAVRDIVVSRKGGSCPGCGGRVLPTDALRIHEEVSEEHGNETALGRLMTVLEHITMVAYLYFLLQRQPRILGQVGFVLDGPLALFGPQAWLHGAMLSFLRSLRDRLTDQHFRQPVIVGIEKGGFFAEHAAAIGERIPPRYLMLLPDEYIYKHILTFRRSPNSSFGRDTYYGQKFFYKTARGQLLTITIPKTDMANNKPYDPSYYRTLPDTLVLLDRIGTILYKDAVIPVALAHSFASIPLRTGSKVLILLSQETLGLRESGR